MVYSCWLRRNSFVDDVYGQPFSLVVVKLLVANLLAVSVDLGREKHFFILKYVL